MRVRRPITPFLWFDHEAEEAVSFYVSLFADSKVLSITRCGDAGPGPKGSVLVVSFRLAGREFAALNGGPMYHFTEALSLMVECETQEEIDFLWDKLREGGEVQACGWLKDRYGLSWQITPRVLLEMIRDPDPARSARAMQAMMQMVKLDIAALKAAYGPPPRRGATARTRRPKSAPSKGRTASAKQRRRGAK